MLQQHIYLILRGTIMRTINTINDVTRDLEMMRFLIHDKTDSQRDTRHTSQHRHYTTRRHSLGRRRVQYNSVDLNCLL